MTELSAALPEPWVIVDERQSRIRGGYVCTVSRFERQHLADFQTASAQCFGRTPEEARCEAADVAWTETTLERLPSYLAQRTAAQRRVMAVVAQWEAEHGEEDDGA